MAFLRSKGYEIVATNYRSALGELDIVARDGDELVFVEVRSRATGEHGTALETVSTAKQQQVCRVAEVYLSKEAPRFTSCRFDVVGITGDDLEHVVDAFRLS